MEHSYIDNSLLETVEYLISPQGLYHKTQLVWAGDYADNEFDDNCNLYSLATDDKYLRIDNFIIKKKYYRYIINYTKKEYVDKENPLNNIKDEYECIVHPLPLLVAEGNGRGGGDYNGKNYDLCGIWSRDCIAVDNVIPDGFTELVPNFIIFE